MNKTQAFKAFILIMRCLVWIMEYLSGVRGESWLKIQDDCNDFLKEES